MNVLKKAPSKIVQAVDSEKELRLLQTLILSISQAGDLPAAVHMTLCNVCEMTGWTYGQAWQVRSDGAVLECCPAWHARVTGLEAFRKMAEPLTLVPGEGLAGKAWVFKEPVWTDDIRTDAHSPLALAASKTGFQAALCIPVMAGDEAVLVLEFFLFEPRQEDKNHINLITAIAAQLGWLIQKKISEEALRESVERFELAARGSSDGLWDTKIPEGRDWHSPQTSVYYSRRFKQLLGYGPHEMENVLGAWESRIYPEDRPGVIQALRDHLEKQIPYDVECRMRVKNGELRWFSARGAAVWNKEGHPVRMAGSLRDITERKSMEQSLIQSEKISAVGQLAAGIAHELNNPLHTILGYAQGLLQEKSESEVLTKSLRFIEKEARRCQTLVQNLLTFSRREKNGVTAVEPAEITEEVLSLIEAQTRVKNIQLVRDFALQLPVIQGNRAQIQQMLLNLCTNAIDAMPQGGTLVVRILLDQSKLDKMKHLIRFEVEDTGEGIPEDIRHRIFEPFFTTKEAGKGTGLGLSLAYEIVKGHQGDITVSSEVGGGSRFRVCLPV
jgi:PAS domain S-box-containing protein